MISKLAPNGTAGFVLANGSMSTSGKDELEIEKSYRTRFSGMYCYLTRSTLLFNTNTCMSLVH